MSQFYISEGHRNIADYYRRILAMPPKDRKTLANHAAEEAQRYINGGSSANEYDSNCYYARLYRRTNADLIQTIAELEAKADQAIIDEYERCRFWLIDAFELKKKSQKFSDDVKAHNANCARDWVKTNWPLYKAARKIVKGF